MLNLAFPVKATKISNKKIQNGTIKCIYIYTKSDSMLQKSRACNWQPSPDISLWFGIVLSLWCTGKLLRHNNLTESHLKHFLFIL